MRKIDSAVLRDHTVASALMSWHLGNQGELACFGDAGTVSRSGPSCVHIEIEGPRGQIPARSHLDEKVILFHGGIVVFNRLF